MLRDKLFHVKNAIKCIVYCRANVCGATTLFSCSREISATKGAMECNIFFERMNIEIFIRKD
jgi:hypothetical protein